MDKGVTLNIFARLLLLSVLAGCSGCITKPTAPHAQQKELNASLFDHFVTPENVFPDSTQRAQFKMLSTSGSADERSYTFQFTPVKSMNTARHFLLLTIVVTRASSPKTGQVVLSGTGGPGGGFVDAQGPTSDQMWNIRVSLGGLLPASISAPEIDPNKIVFDLQSKYQNTLNH